MIFAALVALSLVSCERPEPQRTHIDVPEFSPEPLPAVTPTQTPEQIETEPIVETPAVVSEEDANVVKSIPPIELQKDADGIYVGSMSFDEPFALMGIGNGINVRSEPNVDGDNVVTRMGRGQLAYASEIVEGWYKLTVEPTKIEGYVRSDLLEAYNPTRMFYARYKTGTGRDPLYLAQSSDNITQKKYHIVDVKKYLPELEYEIIFATPDNFTGVAQYERDMCLLQAGTVEKLAEAQDLFAIDGYTIKVYDAYRPSSVSAVLYDIIGDPSYIAKPGTSIHNRAAAVDISLVDSQGNEIEMPTPMHTLNETANRDYEGMSETARANMDYMTDIMKQCGFTPISSEWWHFSDSEAGQYPALDIPIWEFLLEEYDEEDNLIPEIRDEDGNLVT